MEPDTKQTSEQFKAQLDRIEKSVESTRRYFLWTLIITVAVFVLPLIGLLFAVPALISTYSSLGTF